MEFTSRQVIGVFSKIEIPSNLKSNTASLSLLISLRAITRVNILPEDPISKRHIFPDFTAGIVTGEECVTFSVTNLAGHFGLKKSNNRITSHIHPVAINNS